MRRYVIVLALAVIGAVAPPVNAQTLVPAHSRLEFTSRQMGVPVDGHFRKFDARIKLDPRKPEAGRVMLTIDLTSVALGAAEVEAEVARPAWFDSRKFPQATFESTALKAVGPARYEMSGRLSIKGATQQVVVPMSLAPSGKHTVASGSLTIKRLAYRIGDGEWRDTSMGADDVQVRFRFALADLAPL
jgi:polyisoprenoid-binding protein YceI